MTTPQPTQFIDLAFSNPRPSDLDVLSKKVLAGRRDSLMTHIHVHDFLWPALSHQASKGLPFRFLSVRERPKCLISFVACREKIVDK